MCEAGHQEHSNRYHGWCRPTRRTLVVVMEQAVAVEEVATQSSGASHP